MPPRLPPLDIDAQHALAAALRVAIGGLRRRLRDEMPRGDLSWSQITVLGHLDRQGSGTVTTLARAEGVRPQSMGETVAALKAAGLVNGIPNPADGRQTLLSLTPAGRDMVDLSRAAREDWLCNVIAARLEPDEQHTLVAAVALLQRLIGP